MKTKKVLLMLAVFLGLASSVKAQQLTVEYLVKANVNSPSFMVGAGLPDELHLKILHGICIHATNFIRETCSSHERGGIDIGLHQIFDC